MDQPELIRLQIRHLQAATREHATRLQHGRMLDGAGDDMTAGISQRFDDPQYSEVVGFGAAAGKDDLVGLRTEQCGSLLPRPLDRSPSLASGRMQTRRVSEDLSEEWLHGGADARIDLGRRGIVEVDQAAHGHSPR